MSGSDDMLREDVTDRRDAVTSQQSELEQLEARIRETEARLQEKAAAAGIALNQAENVRAQQKSSGKRGLDNAFASLPVEPDKQPSSARRPPTGHGRKQSTSSSAKRK